MRTFFATCGALALMIPVGLLQSENTNAQDGLRRTQNQMIRPFYRVRQYNACSSRQSAPFSPGRCGSQQHYRTQQRSCGDRFDRNVPQRGFERSTSPPLRGNRLKPAAQLLDQRLRPDSLGTDRNQPGRRNESRSDARIAPDARPRSDAKQASVQPPLPPINERDRNLRTSIQWRSDLRAANQESADTGLPILMKFSAVWCGPCKRMKSETFTDQQLVGMINTCFIPVEVDTDRSEQLARQLRIESVPTTLVISPQGDILQRREGFQSAVQLQRALAGFCQQPTERPLARNQPTPRPVR